MLMKYTQNPHLPSPAKRARAKKRNGSKNSLAHSDVIPMGEGEGNFIVVGERRFTKRFVEIEEDSQC